MQHFLLNVFPLIFFGNLQVTLNANAESAACAGDFAQIEEGVPVPRKASIYSISGKPTVTLVYSSDDQTDLGIANLVKKRLENGGATVNMLDISKVPNLGADYKGPKPETFLPFENLMDQNDGVLLIAPGKNGQVPFAYKEFLDHLDLPKAFGDKPAAIIGISKDGLGASLAVSHLKNTMEYGSANTFHDLIIDGTKEPLTPDGAALSDATNDSSLHDSLHAFIQFVDKSRAKEIKQIDADQPVVQVSDTRTLVGPVNPRITIVSGTDRTNANSLKIARIAAKKLHDDGASVRVIDLGAADAFSSASKEQISKSDGLLFVTPEYNGGMPGILAKFIEEIKIPDGMPSGFIGDSAGDRGGVNPVEQLTQVLQEEPHRVLPYGQKVYISRVGSKIAPDGTNFLTDPNDKTSAILEGALNGFLNFTSRIRAEDVVHK